MFVPRGDEDADGLSGFVESWYVTFDWPGLRVAAAGPDEIDIAWGGRSARLMRYARPDPESIADLSRAFDSVRTGLARQDLGGMLAARGGLMGLVAACAGLRGHEARASHRALESFRRELERRACDDVSVQSLASQTRVTADHLRGLFRSRYGTTPVAYRTAVRMARARDLLVASALNVSEVAERTGYADPLYFSRVFRRHFGVPPSEFIRRKRLPAQYVRDADLPSHARSPA
jgi:AraC-like DNA-binding protein